MSNQPTRTATPTLANGSATTTSIVQGPSVPINGPTLRLRAEPNQPTNTRRIQWAEDVVDNEGMGKKSSKVCCIYHKPKNAGDSSSDESSSDSDSDSEPDLSRAQRPNRRSRPHNDDHDHDDHKCDDDDANAATSKGKGKARKPSPNAYERVPKRKSDNT